MSETPSMAPVVVLAYSVASALGVGRDATLDALRRETAGLGTANPWAAIAGGPVGAFAGLEDHPVEAELRAFDGRNNRLARLALLADGFRAEVERVAARCGRDRVAVILGTTTAGIREGELAFRARPHGAGPLAPGFSYHHTVDHFSLADFVRTWLGLEGLAYTVSTACSSSSKVFGDAALMLEASVCDAVVVGGVDTLCEMSLRGFRSLSLVSPEPCRPFDLHRSGISLGEAAGFALLARDSALRSPSRPPILVKGIGESSDAHHMSAPHPEGLGAELAMREALALAGLDAGAIDYVHLHGTGSRQNDDAEAKAFRRVFTNAPACSSTKGWTGHCLGAAGILGAVMACLALEHGVRPGNLNTATPDPSLDIPLALHTAAARMRNVLTNAFGFGGSNSALVLGRDE